MKNCSCIFSPFNSSLLNFRCLSVPHRRTRSSCPSSSTHRTLLTESATVTLAGVDRFQLSLLARRDEVSMLFEILDDLFADNLSLETAKRRLDRFVIVYCNKCHLLYSPPLRQRYCSSEQTMIIAQLSAITSALFGKTRGGSDSRVWQRHSENMPTVYEKYLLFPLVHPHLHAVETDLRNAQFLGEG